jgi:hypothetical protein
MLCMLWGCGMGWDGVQQVSRTLNSTQPNPTQPNPTQPNPTQPNPTPLCRYASGTSAWEQRPDSHRSQAGGISPMRPVQRGRAPTSKEAYLRSSCHTSRKHTRPPPHPPPPTPHPPPPTPHPPPLHLDSCGGLCVCARGRMHTSMRVYVHISAHMGEPLPVSLCCRCIFPKH